MGLGEDSVPRRPSVAAVIEPAKEAGQLGHALRLREA